MSEDFDNLSDPTTPGASPRGQGLKGRKHLGWAPPTLYIPPPDPYEEAGTPANMSVHSVPTSALPPHMYHHRASEFMFNQFSGIKDFTMSTAKSGLGIGEKSAFWLYNKISSWSKKWFTHIFLTFVIVAYTVGGAVMFQTIEGRNEEKVMEVDIRAKRKFLIEELRNLSIYIPQEKSIGEWHGIATEKLQSFEDHVIEAYKNHQLIVSNHGPKIWTFWNAVVYCSTIYTTIVRDQHVRHTDPNLRTSAVIDASLKSENNFSRESMDSPQTPTTPENDSKNDEGDGENKINDKEELDNNNETKSETNETKIDELKSDSYEEKNEEDKSERKIEEDKSEEVDMAKIEAMVTPEQVLSATVAKKRRTITRRRSTSVGKARSQTPMRGKIDASSSEEEEGGEDERRAKTPERPRRIITRTVSNTVKLSTDSDASVAGPETKISRADSKTKTTRAKLSDSDADAKNKITTAKLGDADDKSKVNRPKLSDSDTDAKTKTTRSDAKTKSTRAKLSDSDADAKSKITAHKLSDSDVDKLKTARRKGVPKSKGAIAKISKNEEEMITKKIEDMRNKEEEAKVKPILRKSKRDSSEEPKPKKNDSASNSERQSLISEKTASLERRSSIPKEIEEQLDKLDNFYKENKKEVINMLYKAKSTIEEKGRELTRRKFRKTDQKRSQSTPRDLTEADLLESFKRAQVATAQREADRKRSSSARGYSSSKSPSPEPQRPARKAAKEKKENPIEKKEEVIQDAPKEKKAKLKSKVKSNKIIEILDPKTSKVIAVKDVGQVARWGILDTFGILRFYSIREIFREYSKYKKDMTEECKLIAKQRRKCINHLIILMIFVGLGGIVFKFTEGAFENFYKCGVKRVKRDFIDLLWIKSHNLREEEWKSLARTRLRTFEDELHNAHEAGIHSYSGQRSWSFLNGIVYCLTVVTTIGYGHLYPTTTTGQALTIIYALIGIPLFLIILTDFGKLFTRCIKFVWSFVRRMYYTGSCRKARKTAQVQEMFKGAQMMYQMATLRRPSKAVDPNMNKAGQSPGASSTANTTAPTTPALSTFEVDDEFNLPISVAILLLVLYMILGACLFGIWEGWNFLAAFYFVFISMSTIGFGDYVPRHPIFMILSIVYLVFGLALMSMCINVVQVKLSDTFNQASAKIGATIGLSVEEDGAIKPVPPKQVEMPQVHAPMEKGSPGSDMPEPVAV